MWLLERFGLWIWWRWKMKNRFINKFITTLSGESNFPYKMEWIYLWGCILIFTRYFFKGYLSGDHWFFVFKVRVFKCWLLLRMSCKHLVQKTQLHHYCSFKKYSNSLSFSFFCLSLRAIKLKVWKCTSNLSLWSL